MKSLLLFILFLCVALSSIAQIANSDFELSRDTMPSLPRAWNVKKVEGFSVTSDAQTRYAGNNSLHIQSNSSLLSEPFSPFSQFVNITVNRAKTISITAYVKTQDLEGSAELWCQVRDKDDQMIEFQNSSMQFKELKGTNDWKKLQIDIEVDTNAKRLLLGGFMSGKGSAWFDNFTLEGLSK